MGNLCTCLPKQLTEKKPTAKRIANHSTSHSNSSSRWTRIRSSSKNRPSLDDATIEEQALAAAILFRSQQQQRGSSHFDRSATLRHPHSTSRKNSLSRSSSSRARSLTDPLLRPHQLADQVVDVDNIETHHFVLVHGGGFGAWCWYKTISLLEETGFKVSAIDLSGSGIHSSDTDNITSLSQYVKPLTEFLERLDHEERVILVGHDFGGACVSYAMELFPLKIVKAIFVAAAMLTNGQSALDMFSQQAGSSSLMHRAQTFLYANGNDDKPPTSIDLDKTILKGLLFSQSPSKDVALASVSMRPIPFAPVLEKLSLSDSNYGSIRRFYIETLEDNAIPLAVQENMINASPPERIFSIKGADHSPFFSKPQALHKLLVEISRIPSPSA